MNKMKTIFLGTLAFISLIMNSTAQTNYKQLKTLNNMFETFDFKKFETEYGKYKGLDDNGSEDQYNFDDGMLVLASKPELYVVSPKDFYVLYKEFYDNGNIMDKGKFFGYFGQKGLCSYTIKIGKWYYFDEKGKLTQEVDEDKKFGKFGYQDVLQFLSDKHEIDLKTGENREKVHIEFYYAEDSSSPLKLWTIFVLKKSYPAPCPDDKEGDCIKQIGDHYYIDGNTGEGVPYKDLVKYKNIMPFFDLHYPDLKQD